MQLTTCRIRLFRNDPRVFFEFNTHESLYNSLRRAKLKYVKSNIVIHHWGKLNMKEKAPYYYQLAKDRLRRYPEDMQSYYYLGSISGIYWKNRRILSSVFGRI